MNLWFRLIAYVLTMWRRKPLKAPFETSTLYFRVWPSDLDTSLHMNNGRYATFADLGRLDLMVRMGLINHVIKDGLTPVLSLIVTRFRREMRCFDTFRLESRILTWQDNDIFIEHKLVFTKGKYAGQTSALTIVKASLYSRSKRSYISSADLLKKINIDEKAPPLGDEVKALIECNEQFRKVTSSENNSKKTTV